MVRCIVGCYGGFPIAGCYGGFPIVGCYGGFPIVGCYGGFPIAGCCVGLTMHKWMVVVGHCVGFPIVIIVLSFIVFIFCCCAL